MSCYLNLEMQLTFYIAALVAILSTIMVITRFNIIHALLYLVVSFLALATVFFILGAPFAAALEIIIYAGAIVVLIIFVIMMLNLKGEAIEQEKQIKALTSGLQRVSAQVKLANPAPEVVLK